MSQNLYAIIDIETTGMLANRERITEIAIVLHDGNQIIESFESLVNPERSIPYNITQVTGINDRMVADAPKFFEIAKKIVKMTEGAIFVAHNVRFDYSFVQEEFRRLGFTYVRKQLCTVRMSRTAFPEIKGYSLGNLIKHFKIKVPDRHRAMADAMATVQVFERILKKDGSTEATSQIVNKGVKENNLPNGITLEKLHALPESCGVYYLHDKVGEVIYIGKSINIQKRIFEHFADKTPKGDKLQKSVFDISFEETGSELAALLLENYEIKRQKPEINKAQRRVHFPYCVYSYTDEQGYRRFHAVKNVIAVRKKNDVLQEFVKLQEAKSYLKAVAKRFELCEKLMDLSTTSTGAGEAGCFNFQIGLCRGACLQKENAADYNERAEEALMRMKITFDTDFFVVEQGRSRDEKFVVLVQDGHFRGFGYLEAEQFTGEDLFETIKKYPTNADADRIVRTYLNQNPRKVQVIKF